MVIVDTCPNWILVWTSKLDSSLEKAAIHNVAALQAANIILQTGSARTVALTRAKEKIRIDLDFS